MGQSAMPRQNMKESGVTNRKAGLQIIRGKWNLGVKGENFDVLFSYNSCGLVSYRYMEKS